MLIIFIESVMIGITVSIISTILFNEFLNTNHKLIKSKDIIKPSGITFAFFTTGMILHIVMNMLKSYN